MVVMVGLYETQDRVTDSNLIMDSDESIDSTNLKHYMNHERVAADSNLYLA